MLYVFHGTDNESSRKKASALVDSLRAKKPDASYVPMNAESWDMEALQSHFGGQGLFSNKYIVFLDRVTENIEAKERLPEFAPAMGESDNIFIVLEGKANAETKKAFEKSAEKAVVTDEKEGSGGFKKKEFNVFALGDAIGSRNALKSWLIYRQALENGLESESIVGTLFWQVKSMIASAPAKTAKEAGLNPFVYTKSKGYSKNYSEAEMKTLLSDLVSIYHDGHRGIRDMELAVEERLLKIGKR